MRFSQRFSPWRQRHSLLAVGTVSLFCGLSLCLAAARLLHPAIPPPLPHPVSASVLPPADPLPAPLPATEPAVVVAAAPDRPPTLVPSPPAAWRAYAVGGNPVKPMIAVIIDDMGLDRRRSDRVLALPAPLTISYMTYADHLADQAAAARARGHELMMHMPMQPLSAKFDAGPDVLMDALPVDELRRRITADLDRFQGYVGVNNHMGSRFTADRAGMQLVMQALHERGLLFIDSLTTGHSVAVSAAHQAGVPVAARDVFIDDRDDALAIREQLARVEAKARKTGSAIAIGHPRDQTIAALSAWLPSLAERGLTLVPVTAVVRDRASPISVSPK